MSLLSMYVAPGHVEVCTDTLSYDFEGAPLGLCTKFCALTHCRSTIFTRGPVVILVEVSKRVIATALADVDELIAAMPVLLGQVCDEFLAALPRTGLPVPNCSWGLAELTVVGWSSARKRMIVVQFKHDGEAVESKELADGPGFSPHPADPTLGVNFNDLPEIDALRRAHARDLSKFRLPQTFIASAKIQQLVARVMGHNIGGDLILCRLTRHETTMRTIYRFEDADEMFAELRGLDPAESQARLGYNMAGEFA